MSSQNEEESKSSEKYLKLSDFRDVLNQAQSYYTSIEADCEK